METKACAFHEEMRCWNGFDTDLEFFAARLNIITKTFFGIMLYTAITPRLVTIYHMPRYTWSLCAGSSSRTRLTLFTHYRSGMCYHYLRWRRYRKKPIAKSTLDFARRPWTWMGRFEYPPPHLLSAKAARFSVYFPFSKFNKIIFGYFNPERSF